MDHRSSLPRPTTVLLLFLPAIFAPGSASARQQPPRVERSALPVSAEPEVSVRRPAAGTTAPPAVAPSKAALLKHEDFALAVPTPENARNWLKRMTREPHVAGTAADKDTAIELRDRLRSWGWRAELAEYEVLLNYPESAPELQILKPNRVDLKTIEDPFPLDKDSANSAAFPAFHGYGVSGDVSGGVVYANYGRPEDFDTLDKLGASVKGKIVLVRYGEIFRGLKVRNAQKLGAIGVLIYSDPADDGYAKGDVYPNGPYRPASAIQRGSVQFLSLGPGDPSTPDGPSIKGAKRLPIDPADGFTLAVDGDGTNRMGVKAWEKATGLKREDYFASIPSLPISYEAARPILEALGGPVVPTGWQGGLPLTYHVGPGPAEVRFRIKMDYAVRTIWNVIATLKGSVEPERWVMVGNHRDAWVYGAADPSSGTAATMEMCRALGAAVKNGWSPRRTVVYASWDAEEYGLVGSTEWADEHADTIKEKAVLLLNVDTAVSGPDFDIDGVPSLRDFLLDAAAKVTDGRTGRSLKEIWTSKQRAKWAASPALDLPDSLWDEPADVARRSGTPRFFPQLSPLGSGSDYTAFLDHLGVPAIDVGFGGRYGVYHAVYDNFFWMEKFGDPEFVHHTNAARIYTLLAMRAASLDVVPLRFVPYGRALRDAVDDFRRLIQRKNRTSEGAAPFDFKNLPRLVGSIKELQTRASEADRAADRLLEQAAVDPARLSRFNDALTRVEREFLLPGGLPGRPWFRHAVYAPGLTTGYAAWVLPGLRQAFEDGDANAFGGQVVALSLRIDAVAAALKRAAEIAAEEEPKERPAPRDDDKE